MKPSTLRSNAGLALAGASLLGALTGCSFGPMQMSGTGPTAGTLSISGRAFGGQQPIVGAAINVYAAGATGYGAGATSVLNASTSVTTDSNGFFTLTGKYTCPSSTVPVYVTATGGNPGAGTNSAVRLVAALPSCSALQSAPYVWIDELTTAAAAYSLSQYATTSTTGGSATDTIGAPNTTQAQLGMANAFAMAASLVNTTNGQAVTSTVLPPNKGITITVTPESAKLTTIANILASCINSVNDANSTCQQTLFPDVTPSSGTAPTDVFQAAVMMNLNPALNTAALYNLQPSTPPYAGGLSSAPTDFTLGVQYTDTSATPTMARPLQVAVDGYGNTYVLSANSAAGSLVELGTTGAVLGNVSTLNQWGPYNGTTTLCSSTSTFSSTATTFTPTNLTFTNNFGAASGNPGITPRNLAIDPSNNVWFTSTSGVTDATTGCKASGSVFEVITASGTPSGATYGLATNKSAYGLAIDHTGNVFVGEQSGSANFDLFEFPYSSTPGQALETPLTYPVASSTPGTAGTAGSNGYFTPEYMAFDKNGNLWMTAGGNGSSTAQFVELTNINSSSCTPTAGTLCSLSTSTSLNTYNPYTLTGGAASPTFPTVSSTGVFVPDASGTVGVSDVPYTNPASNTLIGTTATFTAPRFAATDGAGNVWVANTNGTPSGGTAGGSISEVSPSGTVLSPSTSNTAQTNPGFVHPGIAQAAGIAVDPSGNVWVANNGSTGSTDSSSVFVLIGAATPAVTPIASSLTASFPTRP